MRRFFVLIFVLLACYKISAQTNPPKPCGPLPSANQLRWQEMEYYAFLHFSTNTYTDHEWGGGDDDPKIFNPAKLDCRQWARVCKEAGMKGIILTAKHHSGFCLWPSQYTDYSIKNSPWKNGKGDIVGDLAKACKEYGLKLGIYLSPWDRNSAVYGKPEYITYFRNQLKELLTNYGDIFEIWFDGANGGSGYYGGARETRKIDRTTYYDWKNTYQLIRQWQPKIVIWNDGGDRGDLRWVGTEAGFVGETNWSLLDSTGEVTNDMLEHGLENGNKWVPGEVNTSIRPGWFYHEYEDSRVKTLPDLMKLYYNSFGRNGTLLLNFPIDKEGLIHATDEKAAVAFAKAVKEAFAVNLALRKQASASNVRGNAKEYSADKALDDDKSTYWATDDDVKHASLIVDFGKPTTFNRFLAQEYIPLGQRVKSFTVETFSNNAWKEIANGTTIGYKRILLFPNVTATKLRVTITDAKGCPLISNIAVYNAPPIITAPVITRDKDGVVHINSSDTATSIFYTLDGSTPTRQAKRFTEPVSTKGKLTVKAIAVDPSTGKSSPVSIEAFDRERKDWKIINSNDPKVYGVIDGNTSTDWYQPDDAKLPADLDIDLGSEQTIKGFRYLPGQYRTEGIISRYQFYTSTDGTNWKLADEGEFSNIKNNPLKQVKLFAPVKARYIRLHALTNTQNDNKTGYAEVDVITQ